MHVVIHFYSFVFVPDLPPAYTPPTQFTVKLDTGECDNLLWPWIETDECCVVTGEELYGVIYSPEHVEEGVKVPAILYTYGGPVVQVRTCLIHRSANNTLFMPDVKSEA